MRELRVDRPVGGLEAEDEDRARAVAAAGEEGLDAIEQAAVRRTEAGARDRPRRLDRILEALEEHGRARAELRPLLQPDPGAGDDAERALRAAEEALRRGSGATGG